MRSQEVYPTNVGQFEWNFPQFVGALNRVRIIPKNDEIAPGF